MSRQEMMVWARVVAVEVVQSDQSPYLLYRLRQQDFLMHRCRAKRKKGEESGMSLRFLTSMTRMRKLQYTEIEQMVLEQISEKRFGISLWPYYFKCILEM